MPYLIEVFKNVEIRNIELEISYYSDNDKKNTEAFCELIKPTPKKVSLIKLEDIKKYKQLSLFD